MNKSEKDAIIVEVAEKVGRAQALYFADFTGLTVAEVTDLRREFRKSGVEYRVVKNTLARKAMERLTGYDSLFDKLAGPTGIAFAGDDIGAPAKIIKKFFDKSGKLKLKAAVVEKQVYDGSKLAALVAMPSRKDVIASILGSLQSPVSGIVNVLNAVARDLVGVIGEIEKKKQAV